MKSLHYQYCFTYNEKTVHGMHPTFTKSSASKDGTGSILIDNPNKEVSFGFLLGDGEFVKWVYMQFLSSREENKEFPELKRIKPQLLH